MRTFAVLSLFLTLICGRSAPAVPDLPNAFTSHVIANLPFFGKMPGTIYFDYTKLSWRLDTTAFGSTQVDIYRYDISQPTHYAIFGGECKPEALNDEMNPMSIPPFAQFVGYEMIQPNFTQHWTVNWFGVAKLNFWVANTTTDNKIDFTLVKFTVDSFGVGVELNYDHVVAGLQPESVFDVTQFGCPNPTPPVTYTVSGFAKSAVDNSVISGATVTLGSNSVQTDAQGIFSFTGVVAGVATLTFRKTGFFDLSRTVNVTRDIAPGAGADASLSPKLLDGQWRAVLTWGTQPRDLDTHVYTPFGACEVWFRNKLCSLGDSTVRLDVDATQGYGPETTTFSAVGSVDATFNYKVYIYAPSGVSYAGSMGKVRLYNEAGLQQEINVPTTGYTAAQRWWNVFSLNPKTGNVTVTNTVTN